MASKRIIYRVKWNAQGYWVGYMDSGKRICGRRKKQDVERRTKWEARHVWKEHGIETQVVVHRKNGKFHRESTYGNDPRRSKG